MILTQKAISRIGWHWLALTAGVGLVAAVLMLTPALDLLPNPTKPLAELRLQPPLSSSFLGRDHLGRDILSRLLHGGALTLGLALAGLSTTAVLGVLTALPGGYYVERWPGHLLSLLAQGLLAFPGLLLALIVVALIGNNYGALILAMVLTAWADFHWILHREVRGLRAQPFIQVAHALGYRPARIMMIEILPHVVPSALTLALLHFRQAVMIVSTLSFLGLGPPPPTPTWGLMIAEGRNYFPDAWWIVTFPAIALSLSVLAAGLLTRRMGLDPAKQMMPDA